MLLTALAMCAFAANSILNRVAVDHGWITAQGFATIRVAAGAGMLLVLALAQRQRLSFLGARRWGGAVSLAVYMIGFSLAYQSLDAGAGALILFGATQVAMFAIACLLPNPPAPRQIAGAGVAFLGLAWVLWPGANATVPLSGAALMVCAGLGWAVYTLLGRAEPQALAGTAANFILALPLTAAVPLIQGASLQGNWAGVTLAVISGAVTSGLGYALWYRILPRLSSATAATVMLSVPVIALLAGVVLLNEAASPRLLVGTLVVLGGIAWAVRPKQGGV